MNKCENSCHVVTVKLINEKNPNLVIYRLPALLPKTHVSVGLPVKLIGSKVDNFTKRVVGLCCVPCNGSTRSHTVRESHLLPPRTEMGVGTTVSPLVPFRPFVSVYVSFHTWSRSTFLLRLPVLPSIVSNHRPVLSTSGCRCLLLVVCILGHNCSPFSSDPT